MKIKNIEINFDFLDADNVEKFEAEAKKVVEKSKDKTVENLTYGEALRKECKIVDDFIDNVFGEGIAKKIFEGRSNLSEHIEVFQAIVDEKNNKQQELEKLLERYKPNK